MGKAASLLGTWSFIGEQSRCLSLGGKANPMKDNSQQGGGWGEEQKQATAVSKNKCYAKLKHRWSNLCNTSLKDDHKGAMQFLFTLSVSCSLIPPEALLEWLQLYGLQLQVHKTNLHSC